MCVENTKLVEPTVELKGEFLAMANEFKAEGSDTMNGVGSIEIDNFENSIIHAKNHSRGIDLPQGWVPASTFWLVSNNQIVGSCNIRHQLNEFLENYGGHVGYGIRPSQRQKGYGMRILKLSLEKAKQLGLERVLITCDDDNIASIIIIETNGGKLEDKIMDEGHKVPTRRYWIDLRLRET
ncbi:MAG: GNAT family N-acetyltransferase [Sedimentisphaerales bacterium]|nr:GNAT family N-acetyltransferase [Sedimentisphaerales bacterium]